MSQPSLSIGISTSGFWLAVVAILIKKDRFRVNHWDIVFGTFSPIALLEYPVRRFPYEEKSSR
jgi:hypothetical protein